MSQHTMPLWPGQADDTGPMLTFYPATANANGAAAIICPGGGYHHLAKHEGHDAALWLNAQGFAAGVLTYRLAPHRHPSQINDAQRGIRLMRANAKQWGFSVDAIAVIGFSAGGHLASTLTVHWDKFTSEDDDLASEHSARPNASVLCYPVIDLAGDVTHQGSRDNLLGNDAEQTVKELLSTHEHVSDRTPPVFLWHTAEDPGVSAVNSLMFAQRCHDHGVPVELHMYERGRHGLGLSEELPEVATWTGHCAAFLRRHLVKS